MSVAVSINVERAIASLDEAKLNYQKQQDEAVRELSRIAYPSVKNWRSSANSGYVGNHQRSVTPRIFSSK